jgi:hypothetical protein
MMAQVKLTVRVSKRWYASLLWPIVKGYVLLGGDKDKAYRFVIDQLYKIEVVG